MRIEIYKIIKSSEHNPWKDSEKVEKILDLFRVMLSEVYKDCTPNFEDEFLTMHVKEDLLMWHKQGVDKMNERIKERLNSV